MKNLSIIILISIFVFNSCEKKGEKSPSVIESIKNATSLGEDEVYKYEYTYKMQLSEEQGLQPAGNAVMFVNKDAVRSEVDFQFGGMGQGKMIMLGLKEDTDKTYLLNEKKKSYSVFNTVLSDKAQETIKALNDATKENLSVIGNENINGYDCTHLRVTSTVDLPYDLPGMDTTTTTDYWMSKKVPGYMMLSALIASRPEMLNTKDEKIYEYGLLVKMEVKEGNIVNMIMELSDAGPSDISADKFKIPSDYSEQKK